MNHKQILALQSDETFTKLCSDVTLSCGGLQMIMAFKVPSLQLFLWNPSYFHRCTTVDGSYHIGLDEMYETFDAFEACFIDFLNGGKVVIDFDIPRDIKKLQSALAFNKDIYLFSEVPKDKKFINEASELVKRWYVERIKNNKFCMDELLQHDEEILKLLYEKERSSICRKTDFSIDYKDLPNYNLKKLSLLRCFKITQDVNFKTHNIQIDRNQLMATVHIRKDKDIFVIEVIYVVTVNMVSKTKPLIYEQNDNFIYMETTDDEMTFAVKELTLGKSTTKRKR